MLFGLAAISFFSFVSRDNRKELNPFMILTWLKKKKNCNRSYRVSVCFWQKSSQSPTPKKAGSSAAGRMWEFRVVSIHKKYKVICLSKEDCLKVTGTPDSSGKLHQFSSPLLGDLLMLLKTRFVTVQGLPCPCGLFLWAAIAWSEVSLITSPPTGAPDIAKWSHNGSLEASPEALPSSAGASPCPVTSEARKGCWNINLLPSTLHMKLLH